jgi:hypothetical protein
MGVEPTAACSAARRAVLKTGGSTGIQPFPFPSIPERKWIVKSLGQQMTRVFRQGYFFNSLHLA